MGLILIWLDLVVLCCRWFVFFFFFFLVQLLGFVVVVGGPTVGWVSVALSEWVLGQWVAVWVCYLVFIFFIFFLGVDGRLWVAAGGGSGGGGVRCV